MDPISVQSGQTDPGRRFMTDDQVGRLLNDVLNEMPEGVQVIDRDWRYLYVNDTVCRQGKSSREKLLGRTMTECYPGIDQTPLWRQMVQAMDRRFSVEFENEFAFPDGSRGVFLLYIHPVEEGIMILSVDVSAKDRVLMESIGDGVVAIDRDWRITTWNSAAARITGWSRDEAVGQPFRLVVRLVREHDRSENVLFISDAMLSKRVRFMENHTLLVRKDGTEIPVGDSAAPIIDGEGQVSGAIIVFRDASAERDAALIRSSFAYASHQLRTPVTKALWGLEEALAKVSDEEAKELVRIAYRSVRSVRKLVSSLVDVSEIEQGHVLPVLETTTCAEVIKAASQELADLAQARQVAVACDSGQGVTRVRADRKIMVRVMTEVLHNAIEYSVSGGRIEVSARPRAGELVITVADRGIGIPEDQQSLVFTKFFRGHNVPADSDGVGLGLYVSRELLKAIGGKIWFESQPGQGTTFFVSIPKAAD